MRTKRGESGSMTCIYDRCPKRTRLAGTERYAPGEITLAEQRTSVRLMSGPMHADCYNRFRADVDVAVRNAVAAGTHTLDTPTNICSRCRRDVVIYSGAKQGKEIYCLACWILVAGLDDFTERQLVRFAQGDEPNPLADVEPRFPERCRDYLKKRIDRREAARRFSQNVGM